MIEGWKNRVLVTTMTTLDDFDSAQNDVVKTAFRELMVPMSDMSGLRAVAATKFFCALAIVFAFLVKFR